MGAEEISAFLTYLAVNKKVSASTQNQAFFALLFLYRDVLKINLPRIERVIRAKRSEHLPTVFTNAGAKAILTHLNGVPFLVASLLYGAGLRLAEALRLRVKDLNFETVQLIVRWKGSERSNDFAARISLPTAQKTSRAGQVHSRGGFEGRHRRSLATVRAFQKISERRKRVEMAVYFSSTKISPTREDG